MYVRPEIPKDIASTVATAADMFQKDEPEIPLTAEELKALRFPYNKTAFDVDMNALIEQHPPWRQNRVDLSNYFNYGFTEASWKAYAEKQLKIRAAKGEGPLQLPAVSAPAPATGPPGPAPPPPPALANPMAVYSIAPPPMPMPMPGMMPPPMPMPGPPVFKVGVGLPPMPPVFQPPMPGMSMPPFMGSAPPVFVPPPPIPNMKKRPAPG